MSRTDARPGDGIWVTGTLGGARAAVESWNAGATPDDASREAFAHPVPRIEAGIWLAEHGATAMMDVSDGLGGDAQATAARLSLHRSSLYYRLDRISAFLGIDLGDGLGRLGLHLALKSERAARRRLG